MVSGTMSKILGLKPISYTQYAKFYDKFNGINIFECFEAPWEIVAILQILLLIFSNLDLLEI